MENLSDFNSGSKTSDFISDNDPLWKRTLGFLGVIILGPILLASVAWFGAMIFKSLFCFIF